MWSTRKINCGWIFCDYAKAFHCSTHDILLLKLNCYVKDGKTNEWIKSIMHFQVEELKKHGIPQWSILGPPAFPTLYKWFINDY